MVDDPISMHLLMENAMHDSSDYEILTPEEIDRLKKQVAALNTRIAATKRKLAMETKVRDAATSITKLDGPNATPSNEAREAIKKCEDLGHELWEMDKEHTLLQKRLLEHTAGVLQMTHRGYSKDMSVASLTVGSTLPDEDFEAFDVNSGLYRPYQGDFEDGIIDIGGAPTGEFKKQQQIIEDVESRLERLNAGLADMISRFDNSAPLPPLPKSLQDNPNSSAVDVLLEQMASLERGMASAQQAAANQRMRDDASAEKLHSVNRQIYEAVTGDSSGSLSPTYAAPPHDADVNEQIGYLAGGVGKLKHLVGQMSRTVNDSGNRSEDFDAMDAELQKLWNVLIADETGSPRASSGHFSLAAFSSKVQAVAKQQIALQQQKEVLTRQIQQQRELNASSDEVKDKKISDMTEEVHNLRNQLEVTEQEAKAHLENLTKNTGASASNIEHLEGEVVRLQTELTMSKAELDGAYGSRAQRKAEAAADPVLTARVTTLEKELSETIADYEAMTKATIEHEKEREGLESTVDSLRDQIEKLEVQLSEEKIGLLSAGPPGHGGRSPMTPATEGGRAGGTSAGVLRSEFKRMMKDTREQHAKRLKEEQDERRRLEGIVRQLKKEQLGKGGDRVAAAA